MIGANKVNDFKFGISRLENIQATIHAGARNIVAELGIQGIDTSNPLYWGTPNVNLGGGISNLGENSDIPFNTWDTIIQVTDNFSWTRGKHGFKFGADISRTRYNVLNGTVTRGRFTETGQYTTTGNPAHPPLPRTTWPISCWDCLRPPKGRSVSPSRIFATYMRVSISRTAGR